MDEKSGYPGQQPPPPQYPPASGGGSMYPGLPSAPPSYQQSQTVAGQGTFKPLNVQTYFICILIEKQTSSSTSV